MKKWVLLVLLVLGIIPAVFAGVSFDSLTQTEVNPGATLSIAGDISYESQVQGYFELAMVCDSGTFKLPKVAITLKANEARSFPESISIPKVSISNSMKGSCRVRGEITQDGAVLASATSELFQVSPRLVGDFSIDVERIQAGDSFTVTGDVTRVNGDDVVGSAEVYLVTNGERFLTDVVSFEAGAIRYTYDSVGIPAGNYTVTIIVNDLYGTSQEFSDVASFTLLSDLFVFAKVSADKVDPSDTIKVSGEARTLLNDVVSSGEVFVLLENETFSGTVGSTGEFDVSVPIPSTIKSGKHDVIVRVEDQYHNVGTASVPIDVVAAHTAIVIDISEHKVVPGSRTTISARVTDQAGDSINDDIDLEVRNPENKVLRSELIHSDGKIEITIDAKGIPGTYRVIAKSGSLKSESSFSVDALEGLLFSINAQSLIVENTGNVKYDGDVLISYNNLLKSESSVSILVGDADTIPLGINIPTGVYDIVVSSGKFSQEFKGVFINGVIPKNLTWLYWVLLVLVVVLMGFSIYWMYYKEKRGLHRDARIKKEYRKEIEIIKQKKSTDQPSKSRYSFGNYDQDKMIKDYRNQVLKQIKETEDSPKKKDENKFKGMFD